MKKIKILPQILLFALVISFVSCKKDEPQTGNNNNSKIAYSINFQHYFNDTPVEFDSLIYTDDADNKLDVQKINYFISKVTLVSENGDEVNLSDIKYIDARDPSTHELTGKKEIKKGNYKSLKFVFGLDEELNTSGRFTEFPEISMEWPEPMGGGYHYMMFEGNYEGQDGDGTYAIHLGRLDENENYFTVEIPADINVNSNSFEINLRMNIEKWFQEPNSINLDEMPHMIMMDQDAQVLFKENGAKVFSIE